MKCYKMKRTPTKLKSKYRTFWCVIWQLWQPCSMNIGLPHTSPFKYFHVLSYDLIMNLLQCIKQTDHLYHTYSQSFCYWPHWVWLVLEVDELLVSVHAIQIRANPNWRSYQKQDQSLMQTRRRYKVWISSWSQHHQRLPILHRTLWKKSKHYHE